MTRVDQEDFFTGQVMVDVWYRFNGSFLSPFFLFPGRVILTCLTSLSSLLLPPISIPSNGISLFQMYSSLALLLFGHFLTLVTFLPVVSSFFSYSTQFSFSFQPSYFPLLIRGRSLRMLHYLFRLKKKMSSGTGLLKRRKD